MQPRSCLCIVYGRADHGTYGTYKYTRANVADSQVNEGGVLGEGDWQGRKEKSETRPSDWTLQERREWSASNAQLLIDDSGVVGFR